MAFLSKKQHIKEYKKIRKMHQEIISAMVKYNQDGKFEKIINNDFCLMYEDKKSMYLLEANFDLGTREGAQGMYDMLIYKITSNMNCITEDFIRKQHYKKPEKIEFLNSMLNSKLGLFEVTSTNMEEGYVYIKDVFTGIEDTIIDIGLSGQPNYDECYFYTRIITHRGISFGSGLNIVFKKTDDFIKNHIKEHKKDFNLNGEFLRFTQLYNHYSQDDDRVKTVSVV